MFEVGSPFRAARARRRRSEERWWLEPKSNLRHHGRAQRHSPRDDALRWPPMTRLAEVEPPRCKAEQAASTTRSTPPSYGSKKELLRGGRARWDQSVVVAVRIHTQGIFGMVKDASRRRWADDFTLLSQPHLLLPMRGVWHLAWNDISRASRQHVWYPNSGYRWARRGYTGWVSWLLVSKILKVWQDHSPNCDFHGSSTLSTPQIYDRCVCCEEYGRSDISEKYFLIVFDLYSIDISNCGVRGWGQDRSARGRPKQL
jgi:hypothetical protein